jgi:peptidoglycan hydrolase CwlO-like protein
LADIRRDIETLAALTGSLDTVQDAHAERLAELDAAMARLESRIQSLEDSKAAALEALGQLRESLV